MKGTEKEDYIKDDRPYSKAFANFFDILQSVCFAIATVVLVFIFIARVSVVEGNSMNPTLKNNDYLIVSNIFFTYQPRNGDIVVIHQDFEGENYDHPIVKRVIATEGQTLKIVFPNVTMSDGNIVGVYDSKANAVGIAYDEMQVYVDGVLIEEDYAQFSGVMHYPTLCYPLLDSEGKPILDEDGNQKYAHYFRLEAQTPIFDPITEEYNTKYTGVFEVTIPEGQVFVMGDNRYTGASADSRISEIGFVDNSSIVGKAVFRLLPFASVGALD